MMLQILQAQLTDPFRIVMLIALVYVWHRNRGPDGGILPLVAGYLFVAVLIPATNGTSVPLVAGILMGLIANLIILLVVLGARMIWQHLRKR